MKDLTALLHLLCIPLVQFLCWSENVMRTKVSYVLVNEKFKWVRVIGPQEGVLGAPAVLVSYAKCSTQGLTQPHLSHFTWTRRKPFSLEEIPPLLTPLSIPSKWHELVWNNLWVLSCLLDTAKINSVLARTKTVMSFFHSDWINKISLYLLCIILDRDIH